MPKKTLFQDSQSEDEATGDEAAVSKSDTTKEKVSEEFLMRENWLRWVSWLFSLESIC